MMVFSFFPCFLPFFLYTTHSPQSHRVSGRRRRCAILAALLQLPLTTVLLPLLCWRSQNIIIIPRLQKRGKSGIEKVSVWSSGVLLRDLPFFSFAPLFSIPPTDVPEVSAGTHFVVSLRCHTPVTASVLFFLFFSLALLLPADTRDRVSR